MERRSDIDTFPETMVPWCAFTGWELFIAALSGAVNNLANVGLNEVLLLGFAGD